MIAVDRYFGTDKDCMKNLMAGFLLKLVVGSLFAICFVVSGFLLYSHFEQEADDTRKNRMLSRLNCSVSRVSSNLHLRLREYQLEAYSAINNKLQQMEQEQKEKFLAWTVDNRRYSFFKSTNVEAIRFLTGGLFSDVVVPETAPLSYVLRFPFEHPGNKLYMVVAAPGNVAGYLLTELDMKALLSSMMSRNDRSLKLDSYLITGLNRIVLARDEKYMGKNLTDVLVQRYDFFDANTLLGITGQDVSSLIHVEDDVVYGVGWQEIQLGDRQFVVVVVAQDSSHKLLLSSTSINRLYSFLVLLLIFIVFWAVVNNGKRKQADLVSAVLAALPFASILYNRDGKVLCWNDKIEETFGFSKEEFNKQLFASVDDRQSLFGSHFLARLLEYVDQNSIQEVEKDQDCLQGQAKRFQFSSKEKKSLIESTVRDIYNKQGDHFGAIEFFHDVTRSAQETERLKSLRQIHEELFSLTEEGVWLLNNITGRFFLSERACMLLGYERDELGTQDDWWNQIHRDDYSRVLEAYRLLSSQQSTFEVEYRIKHKQGHYLWLVTKGVGVWEKNRLVQTVGCHWDVSAMRSLERAFATLYSVATASYLNRGMGRYLESVHASVAAYTGVDNFLVLLRPEKTDRFEFLYYKDEKDPEKLGGFSNPGEYPEKEIPGPSGYVMRRGVAQIFTADSEEMRDYPGQVPKSWLGVPIILDCEPVGVVAVFDYESKNSFNGEDIQLMTVVAEQLGRAIEREQVHEHLYYQATHDNLTGLLNREHFMNWGTKLFAGRKREQRRHALFMMDLDRFKQINDSLGHHVGDQVLIEAAKLIKSQLREVDTFARLGGDEFAVLLENSGPPADVIAVAERIITSFRRGMHIGGRHIVIGTSIGIVVDIDQYDSIGDAMRSADIAMYEAKRNSSHHIRVFNKKLHSKVQLKRDVEQILLNEFKTDEFIVYYEPIIDLVGKKIAGFEALVRWKHPRLGFMQPEIFLPIAEECGILSKIDRFVLEQACQDMVHWQQHTELARRLTVSVNLAKGELVDIHLAQRIVECAGKNKLDTSCLLIEFSESALIDNLSMAQKIFSDLRREGVGVRIDDFGTGYSSFAHLADLLFDTLKIDRSFLVRAVKTEQGMTVLKALIEMSKSLNIPVVAEGVGTDEQYRMIAELGCQYGQGYYFSRSLRQDMVIDFIKNFSFD